jgi:predicted nucleic acid-binding protein
MRKPKAIVLDSWAVMAFLEDEESAGERVADIISDAHDAGTPLLMTVVNAGEIWYVFARRTSVAEADKSIKVLEEIGIKFVDVDWPLTKLAAGFKVKGNISYADCYAAALTKQHRAHLVTGDKEFQQVETDVAVIWL